MLRDIGGLSALTARLLARFWPQLLLAATLGYIARVLLLEAAVGVGLKVPLGGMVTLSLVVLVKLLVVIAMFAILRPGLPALAALRGAAPGTGVTKTERLSNRLLVITSAAILPFFAYYAAWGFLGDTVREYSRLALDRVALGERLQIFELLRSRSLVAAILACWLVRWLAKRANGRLQSPWLRFVIVAADASWIFIGLYALDRWKDDFIGWIGAGAFLDMVKAGIVGFSMEAHAAAGSTAVEFQEPGLAAQAQELFFYALLPLVWLVMAAIVYGYDLSAKPVAAPRHLLAPPRCANGWPISPSTSSEATGPATGRSGPACARCSAPASGRCSPSSCFTAPPAGSPPGRGTAQPVISGRTISKPGSG
ncbi:hypothetical protein Q1M65_15540 [Sinorhizobium meliloti]|nr:hypothetical protein Q1M65_15540 [Sinorhizobium meliloti]